MEDKSILDDALRRIANLEREATRQSRNRTRNSRKSKRRGSYSSSCSSSHRLFRKRQRTGYDYRPRRDSTSSSSSGTTHNSRSRSGEYSKRISYANASQISGRKDGVRVARREPHQARAKGSPGERDLRGTTQESGNSPDIQDRSNLLLSSNNFAEATNYQIRSPESTNGQEILADSLLAYIGSDIISQTKELKILQPIAENWLALTKSGLSKESKEQLLEKYPIPENCPGLGGPALNPELKLTLAAHALKRDGFQLELQNQLGAALSALGQAFSKTLRFNPDDEVIKAVNAALGDAGRILTDLHYKLSTTRRSFILPGLSLLSRNVATEGPVDTLLFGESFTERVKTASTLEKTGKDMLKKPLVTSTVVSKPVSSYKQKQYLNSKPPVRKYNQKSSYQTGGKVSRSKSSHHQDSRKPINHRR